MSVASEQFNYSLWNERNILTCRSKANLMGMLCECAWMWCAFYPTVLSLGFLHMHIASVKIHFECCVCSHHTHEASTNHHWSQWEMKRKPTKTNYWPRRFCSGCCIIMLYVSSVKQCQLNIPCRIETQRMNLMFKHSHSDTIQWVSEHYT